jgi:eukaryotic-like serine/threonine-protein kinase
MSASDTRLIADRYALHRMLGRGGAGAVWRGVDQRLQRDVAVKEVHFPPSVPDAEREAIRTRVFREARSAGRLTHEGVTTVYDVLEEGGQAYIVMELVDAPTLTDLVRTEGPLEPERAAGIGLQILSALAAAHGAGIVHRDVKPSNVMVDAGAKAAGGDRVKLTDFGIAAVKDDPSITATGNVIGSPSYMAPEQARSNDASPASDLWGLGATLFFAVEGKAPFDRGQAMPTLHAVLNDDLPEPTNAGALGPVIADLLEKDPLRRPNAEELRRRLEQVAGDAGATAAAAATVPVERTEPAPAPRPAPEPDPAPEPEPAPADDARRPMLIVAGLLLLLVAGVAVWGLLREDAPEAAAPEEPAGDPATEEPADEEEAAEPEEQAEPSPDPAAEDAAEEADESADATGVEVPDGWTTHTDDATGYQIAYPGDWEVVTVSQTLTDFRDPSSPTYLRVDWTDAPPSDPVADWQQQSQSFGARHEGYEEIRIEPYDYRGYDAAMWEYRYVADGLPVRAYNLGIDTGTYGHALNFQTSEELWEESQDLYATFQEVFQPGG